MAAVHEKVKFRLFKMPCCGHLLCWVNPRLPSYCPECGKMVYKELNFDGADHTMICDEDASLHYHT